MAWQRRRGGLSHARGIVRLLDLRDRAAAHTTRTASATMQFILALPPLLEERADKSAAPQAPALAHLLAMAGLPVRESGGVSAALASRYGVVRQTDWPLAPIRLAALGVDPGTDYWLAADPVTLEVGRVDVELARVVDDFDRAAADALLATLNSHFANDEVTFAAPRPDGFFVRVAAGIRLSTSPPAAAMRRPLRGLLPQGSDAAAWRRYQSEIEMLLHEHPVNVEREGAGRPPANTLWFYEGGTLPSRPVPAPSIATFAASGVACALAAHSGTPLHSVPRDLHRARSEAGNADSIVVVLDRALDLSTLERGWAAPARDALVAGSLDGVTLIGDEGGTAIVWQARRPRLWQRVTGRYRTRDLGALLDTAIKGG